MRIERLDYKIPKELIAQAPTYPRDSAKLLVFDRKTKKLTHSNFKKIGDFLTSGDVLVFNKTKVFPARIYIKNQNDKKVEIVFLAEIKPKMWEVIIGGKTGKNEVLNLTKNIKGQVLKNNTGSYLRVNVAKNRIYNFLAANGHVPLPPYIKRKDIKKDSSDYQTVYAKTVGSAAAPTAGLHFTKSLIKRLESSGIETAYITLHVGLGTFAPVKSQRVEDHPIHGEYYEINKETAKKINKAKKEGRRVIACGTTVTRALESAVSLRGNLEPQKKKTKLFIYPGYDFGIVNGLVTNFHTPRSSLLALVYAFAGEKNIKRIYTTAAKEKYRFFSYGDGMLIL